MSTLNKLYFVINLTESNDNYKVFLSREQAEQYIKDYIQYSILEYEDNIYKNIIRKHLVKVLKVTAPILVLKSLLDLPFFIQNKIPWDHIKKNYNLSHRFLQEFEEYL